jgi:hypothetical protein
MADIHGVCGQQFEAVRDALERNLDSGEELGASLVLDIDGDIVVDMWAASATRRGRSRGPRTPSPTSGHRPRP